MRKLALEPFKQSGSKSGTLLYFMQNECRALERSILVKTSGSSSEEGEDHPTQSISEKWK